MGNREDCWVLNDFAFDGVHVRGFRELRPSRVRDRDGSERDRLEIICTAVAGGGALSVGRVGPVEVGLRRAFLPGTPGGGHDLDRRVESPPGPFRVVSNLVGAAVNKELAYRVIVIDQVLPGDTEPPPPGA